MRKVILYLAVVVLMAVLAGCGANSRVDATKPNNDVGVLRPAGNPGDLIGTPVVGTPLVDTPAQGVFDNTLDLIALRAIDGDEAFQAKVNEIFLNPESYEGVELRMGGEYLDHHGTPYIFVTMDIGGC
jgi:hypothetical protein